VLLALMLAAAIWLRSRPMLFAWFFALFSVLPFIFVPHYSGFFIYLPMLGWTLFGAMALVKLRNKWAPRMPDWATFLCVAAALAPLHIWETPKAIATFDSARVPTTEAIEALERVKAPRGAHIFFTSDPFPAGQYTLQFLMEEFYGDRSLEIRRAKDGARFDAERWDMVLAWRNGTWEHTPEQTESQ
jgi:hypothetical protein